MTASTQSIGAATCLFLYAALMSGEFMTPAIIAIGLIGFVHYYAGFTLASTKSTLVALLILVLAGFFAGFIAFMISDLTLPGGLANSLTNPWSHAANAAFGGIPGALFSAVFFAFGKISQRSARSV